MKPYLLLTIALAISFAGRCQHRDQKALRDSLMTATEHMIQVVDSLRNRASHQDSIYEGIKNLITVLSKSKDTGELPGWRITYRYEKSRFDSTLNRLDSSIHILTTLSDRLNALKKN